MSTKKHTQTTKQRARTQNKLKVRSKILAKVYSKIPSCDRCGVRCYDLFRSNGAANTVLAGHEIIQMVCCVCKYGEPMRVDQGDYLLCPESQCSSRQQPPTLDDLDKFSY